MSAFFAIASAFLYALTNVLVKRGLSQTDPSSATIISLLGSFFSAFIFFLFYASIDNLFTRAFYFFLAAGIIGPFFGRLLLFKGIDRVGAAISTTLFADRTLFAVLGAMLLLGERLTPVIGLGIALMLAGTIIVSFEREGGQIKKDWSKIDLLFPIAAGACYGASQFLRKMGLNITPDPAIGVMVQNIGAVLLLPLFSLPRKRLSGSLFSKKTSVWTLFLGIGFLQALAQWCFFKALDVGSVVVVSPLSALNTFFVLILTALFLKKIERVTPKIVLGAVLMVAASIIITLRS
jgi:drug/metabolite transporter, DME family